MQVHRSLSGLPAISNPVVSVGTYDGVHIGHSKIIERLKNSAAELKGESVIITFDPHPRMVLFPENSNLKLLNTLDEKIQLLQGKGIGHLIVQPFSHAFSRVSGADFIRDILVNTLHLKKIIIGYNHQFGRNREGTFEQLKEMAPLFKFELEEIPEQDVNQIAVSSTKIRNFLLEGKVTEARDLLGYPYEVSGKVVRGAGNGKKLGFPTANIFPSEPLKLIPGHGIYAVKIYGNNIHHQGMLYIGKRPFFKGEEAGMEVHIFDFEGDLYGSEIRVSFFQKIRDDQNFSNRELLIAQMLKDRDAVKLFFLSH